MFFLLTNCILAVSTNAFATDSISVNKYLGGMAGVYNMASIDKVYSPFSYSGKSATFGFIRGSEKINRSFETNIFFSNIQRKARSLDGVLTPYEPGHFHLVKNSFVLEIMEYFRFLMKDFQEEKLQFYFSGLWFTSVNITTNSSGVPELIQSGIAPGIMVRRKIRDHSFKTEIHSSLLTWSVRNSYSVSSAQTYEKLSKFDFIMQNSMIQTPISNQCLYINCSYGYSISEKFSMRANYNSKYMHNNRPQTLKSISGIYSISLIYNR